jgi:hypothetical protein
MVLLWCTWDSVLVVLPLTAAVTSLILLSRGDTREKALLCLSPRHWGGDRGGTGGGGTGGGDDSTVRSVLMRNDRGILSVRNAIGYMRCTGHYRFH